jgi:hypothetical protein
VVNEEESKLPIESPDDLASFFETDDFAVECVITGPDDFEKTLNVILDAITEPVDMYGDTNVEVSNHHFICREADLVNVKRGMTATVEGRAYTIARIAVDQVGVATVYLKK